MATIKKAEPKKRKATLRERAFHQAMGKWEDLWRWCDNCGGQASRTNGKEHLCESCLEDRIEESLDTLFGKEEES